MFKPFVQNKDKLDLKELFQASKLCSYRSRNFLKFDIQNKIEHTFRPVKLAKIICHNVID